MSRTQSRRNKRFQIGSVLAIAVAGVTSFLPRVGLATNKDNNNFPLIQGLSWVGGIAPTPSEMAVFDGTFATGNPSLLLGGNVTWFGISAIAPVQDVTIGVGNTLTLGSGGIDTTQSQFALSINSNIQLSGTGQSWTATGALNIGGPVNLGGGTLFITTVNNGTNSGMVSVTGTMSNGTVVASGNGFTTLSGNDSLSQIIVNAGTASLFGTKTATWVSAASAPLAPAASSSMAAPSTTSPAAQWC